MGKKSGVGLGTVLVVVAMVVTLGFALAGASIGHLNLQSKMTNGSRALDVARAAVNLGLERVLANPDYGKNPGDDTLLEFKDSQGAIGRMTFNPTQATLNGIPASLNNLSGVEVKPGSTGQLVPLKAVHLVATGSFRNVTRTVEVVLSLPPYPYAAASDGPISARSVIVGALPPNTDPGLAANARLKPANLLSNASGSNSLFLGEGSTVSGDLMARGGIKVDRSAQVKGLVRPNQEERELPRWKTEDYDPKLLGRPYLELQETYTPGGAADPISPPPGTPATPGEGVGHGGPPTEGDVITPGEDGGPKGPSPGVVKFTGTVRRQGNLNVEGDLDVEGALVYVDGNLNVNGALLGKGVVVTTGNLTVRDHAEVDAQDKVALMAKKKLTLKGGGRSSSLITGILYSEGGFEASQLTLRGVVISRQGASGDKPVTLHGTRVVKDPEPITVAVAPTTLTPGNFVITLQKPGGGLATGSQSGKSVAPVLSDTPLGPAQSGPLIMPIVEPPPGGDEVYYINGAEEIIGTFVVTPNQLPDGEPLYSCTLSTGESFPALPALHLAAAIGEATGLDPRQVYELMMAHAQIPGAQQTPGQQSPGYTLTVKEPSQLLPFYQQARIVLWKEN